MGFTVLFLPFLFIWLTVFGSVDLQRQQGKRDPSPERLQDTSGRSVYPGQPSLLVQQRKHLYEGGDPWLSFAR